MKKFRNRYLTLVLILGLNSILINYLSFDKNNDVQAELQAIQHIPVNLNRWRGEDILLEKKIYEILETQSIIHRKYVSDEGYEVFLSIVYYPETKVDFHAPEGCLGGQGISVTKSQKTITIFNDGKIFQIGINQLIRNYSHQQSLIYYFYKAGDFLGQSYIKLRFHLALNKFSSNEKSGALIRVSTPLNGENMENSSELLRKFIQDFTPYILTYL
jgi:EpsI family protein